MNNVSLIGRLTADPELKTTQSGINTVRFSVAVDRQYTKQGEEKQADFINIVAWRQTAEFICKYFSKGRRIAIRKQDSSGGGAETTPSTQAKRAAIPDNIDDIVDMPGDEDLPF